MSRGTSRLVALTLGVFLAAVLVVVVVVAPNPKLFLSSFPRLMAWFFGRPTVMQLGASPAVDCVELSETMHVVTGVTLDLFEPMEEKEVSSDRRSVRAGFSGHWAETRVVHFRVNEPTVDVEAIFDTDYGLFIGSIDAERSSVHRHAAALCFDLAVLRTDSSSRVERWRAQIQLD